MGVDHKTVPNGSERIGRPPQLSDSELESLVEELIVRNGAFPTLDQIQKAGRCQRSRAVKARKAVQQRLVAARAHSDLRLPDELKAKHEQLLTCWLELARESIQPHIDEAVAQCESQLGAMEETLADERRHRKDLAGERDALIDDAEKTVTSLEQLNQQVQQLTESESQWRETALERMREVQKLRSER